MNATYTGRRIIDQGFRDFMYESHAPRQLGGCGCRSTTGIVSAISRHTLYPDRT